MPALPTWLTIGWLVRNTALTVLLYVLATAVFDCVHWVLHKFLRTKSPLLRWIGGLHQHHHDFWDRELRFHDEKSRDNLLYHRVPEYGTQAAVVLAAYPVFGLVPVAICFALITLLFIVVTISRGRDSNHKEMPVVPRPGSGILVGLPYHALHHVFPEQYISSFTTLFDRVMGTGCQIEGRRIAMTGSSGSFGAPFKELLERQGATVQGLRYGVDYDYNDYSRLDEALRNATILVLAHGAKKEHAMAANCDSFLAIMERFLELHKNDRWPPEVWAVGSEIECHPAWGNADLQIYLESKRAFARRARWYFHDHTFTYRHIVPSAFASKMGPGLISGRTAARIAMFFIKRGYRYVPVSYSGIALPNYFKFLFRVHAIAPSRTDKPVEAHA